MTKSLNKEIIEIVENIQNINGKPYIVGGYVRDYIMGIKSRDIDIEVFNVSKNEFEEKIVSKYNLQPQGKFGVYKKDDFSFSLPRMETKIGTKHKDFEIEVNPFITIEEAIQRRDFTVNSLMYDLQKHVVIDKVNGLKSINEKELIAVSNKFSEDPLRVLRGVRFASTHGFDIEEKTFMMMKNIAPQLEFISINRINDEMVKILTGKYFKEKNSYLIEILSIFLKRDFKKTMNKNLNFKENNFLLNLAILFDGNNQLVNKVINKKEIVKYIINIEQIEKLNSFDQVKKLKNNQDEYLEYLETIDERNYLIRKKEYHKITKLLNTYNGKYFIDKGIEPRKIKEVQRELILKKMEKNEM